jgi:hypothetical protein
VDDRSLGHVGPASLAIAHVCTRAIRIATRGRIARIQRGGGWR